MKIKRHLSIIIPVILLSCLIVGGVLAADDGPLFKRNISRTPETMTGASQMSVMSLYVPAQDTQGEPPDTTSGELEYYAGDCTNQDTSTCTLVYSRPEAKPLIATYNDGIVDEELNELLGIDAVTTGAGFGERDAFAALSLDDGETWKNWNLSDSAARSSFVLKDGHEYPGDVFKEVHVVEGNRVAVAWISRYCESGAPLYSWDDEEKAGLLTAYPELDHLVDVDGGTDDDGYQLYMDDMFGVAGSQNSVDYTLQGFPEVGEIPYGCVWVARGTLEQDLDDETGALLFNTNNEPIYDITWRASERLTSGRRDPHQINITSSPGAGFIISWQEDPEGLRPGKGLGPGEGWSGAIANSKTDIWYTYIAWDHFTDVCLDDPDDDMYCDPGTLSEFVEGDLFGLKPKAAVPFAMPVRLTDNNACKGVKRFDTAGELIDPYCYADFNENGTADFCATSEEWINPGGAKLDVCVAEDGRHLTGRTASTRVRWAMKPYTKEDDTVSAWVLLGEEKLKALGTELEDPEGNPCDPENPADDCTPVDIGKNMWYHTFEFNNPELVAQGLMLNAPAVVPFTDETFPVNEDEWGHEYFDTEIARRFNLFVNSPAAAMASDSQTMGFLIYKQGILFQGGPADIFIRRIVLDAEDVDGDGILDIDEDIDGDGVIDTEDLDGDGILDTEDINGNGILDPAEDLDGDGEIDTEDINGNGVLDEGEDLDGDGVIDTEDLNGNGVLDPAEDLDDDGEIDTEDINGNGIIDTEDVDGDGKLDTNEDLDGNGVLDQFDPAEDNPFAYENVQCVEFDDDGNATSLGLLYSDGSNPNYVRGLCPVSGMNVSGTTIVECDGGDSSADTCAEEFPFSLTYEEWASDEDDTSIPKVTVWSQSTDNFNDEPWENPYDVSKGHRGFIDGDFVMMMYATAPNWKAGTVGNEAYNLYIRRSFDGGQTWTTLPANYTHIDGLTYNGDGTTTCEDYGWGGQEEYESCITYGAGDFEQARNVSRLTGTKVTVLDPRYSPSGGMLKKDYTNLLCYDADAADGEGDWVNCNYTEAPYPEEIRDPSTFFATFETGDNTVVDVETGANPLDMYYSKAFDFGDDWDAQDVCNLEEGVEPWYPNTGVSCEEGETDLRWDWLENGDDWATEASVYGTPDGSKFYAVWNQELPIGIDEHGEFITTNMDTEFRRIFYNLGDTDKYPSARILFTSHSGAVEYEDGLLTFVGSARDTDYMGDGIVAYQWESDLDGVLSDQQSFSIPASSLSTGLHTISFSAQDDESNWSNKQSIKLFVAEVLYRNYLPNITLDK